MTTTPATPRSPSVTRPVTVAGTSLCGTCANTDAAAQSAKRSASAAHVFALTRFGFDGFVFEGARVGMADSSTARTKSEKGGSREADFGVKRAGRLAVQISPRRAAGTCTAARAYTFRKAKVKRQKAKVKTQRQHDSQDRKSTRLNSSH